ncbi:MAG: NADH-quinone oxidoreductase subunit J, partial [Bacteroidota bacterium]|nr:NADH-quinone oxidoreductase subunit J [Bacteroidota bacterium]
YVGGIVVLIIFSIFLTHESGKEMPRPNTRRIVFSLLAVLFGFGGSYNLISKYGFQPSTKPFTVSISDMGMQMLNPTEHGYLLPFEVVSILLLAAMIGCIVIAMKPAGQKPAEPEKAELPGNIKTPAPEEVVLISKSKREEEVAS